MPLEQVDMGVIKMMNGNRHGTLYLGKELEIAAKNTCGGAQRRIGTAASRTDGIVRRALGASGRFRTGAVARSSSGAAFQAMF
jgi:hypothetical protein